MYYEAHYQCVRCNEYYSFKAPYPMNRKIKAELWLWELEVASHQADCVVSLLKKAGVL